MRFHAWLVALSILAGCGDGSGPADDGGPDPQGVTGVPTARGAPEGEPSRDTVGPAGGTVSSSDGLLTLTIPAGALASSVEIEIQPLANTAWGALGKGYRLSPDGLAFAAPVTLELTIPEKIAGSIPSAFLDVATQDATGQWLVLRDVTVDASAGTVTARTRHFSDYSLISGVQIRPPEASLRTGETLDLAVLFCELVVHPDGSSEFTGIISSCSDEEAPLGAFDGWSVSAGGGSVTPSSGQRVTYTAPGSVPSANPVAVSVRATYRDRQELLVANITVVGNERWIGASTYTEPDGRTVTSDVTWNYSEPNGANATFVPSGQMRYKPPPTIGGCASVSLTPDTHPIAAADGFLSVAVDLTGYTGTGGLIWSATQCMLCPGDEVPRCGETIVGGPFMAASGAISEDGTTIAGTTDIGGGATLTYDFRRQP